MKLRMRSKFAKMLLIQFFTEGGGPCMWSFEVKLVRKEHADMEKS